MNELFETTKTELTQKAEIFKKEAEKYGGKLVYTLTAFGVYYDDYDKNLDEMAPENGQKCFGDFSSALNAFFALSEKMAKNNDDWKIAAYNLDRGYLHIISGCLFHSALEELEEDTSKKFLNLGESQSGSFAVCDFYAQAPSGVTCQVTLFVTDAAKAEEKAKDAEDGRSYEEIIESAMDFDNFSQDTKAILYDVCKDAEKVEKAFAEKGIPGLCFVESANNVTVFMGEREKDHEAIDEGIYEECYEEIAVTNAMPFNAGTPYFTSFRAAFINMLNDIIASICPLEPETSTVNIFDTIDGSEEKVNDVLKEVQNGNSFSIFTYMRGDGVSELNIFRDLSVCLLDK